MKQVLQHARTGDISVVEVPAPKLLAGCVLVRIEASLVSAGTERASSEFASKNLLQKAQARPDLVRDVISKVRRDGVLSAISTVRSRLDQPSALGYSSAGTVIAIGEGVTDVNVGDRVACAGAGLAVHAECECVPRLLIAKLPAEAAILSEEAAFTTVGAVALHGIRISNVKLGDVVAVIGLGLVGQLTLQMLKASGCQTAGFDLVAERVSLAKRLGADGASDSLATFHEICSELSHGRGADAVLITAETESSDPVNLAAEVARDRGTIVAVGTVGMDLRRKLYYEKELEFKISRSYGPGRYDAAYEQKGRDYPIGYVRWTETRNMEAFLQLLSDGKIDVQALVTHRVPIARARYAYDLITGKTTESFLGVVITYAEEPSLSQRLEVIASRANPKAEPGGVSIGLVGAGSFAIGTLLPAIKNVDNVQLAGVCAANGAHARHAAEKFGFRYCCTDEQEFLADPSVNTIAIATRHHLHAQQVIAALRAGKHVFCEKPLCLTEEELSGIVEAYSAANRSKSCLLLVGFNRRFSPMVTLMKRFLDEIEEPLSLTYRINAGPLPADHWINDTEQGGGRILGEVCHFLDLIGFLAGSAPISVHTRSLADLNQNGADNLMIALAFQNGSQATITYLANGDRAYSKERLEVFGGGAVAVLDDFRKLELVRRGRKQIFRSRLRQDKGHRGEWEAFAKAISTGSTAPIAFTEIVASTLITIRAADSRASGQPIALNANEFLTSHSRVHTS